MSAYDQQEEDRWNDWRTRAAFKNAASRPSPSRVVAQPSRPDPTMMSSFQAGLLARYGITLPASTTQGQAAAALKTAMAKEVAAQAARKADQIHLDACMARFDRACGL